MPFFEEWESFYVIVGAAAGALIGVQFVVMTLIAENPPPRVHEAGPAFATPTIVPTGCSSVYLLLFVGIHNAWDAIAYHVFVNMRKGKE